MTEYTIMPFSGMGMDFTGKKLYESALSASVWSKDRNVPALRNDERKPLENSAPFTYNRDVL